MLENDKHDTEAEDRTLAGQALAGTALGLLILDLWRQIRTEWSFASDRLGKAFRSNRQLTSVERRFVAESVFGLIRQLRRLDAALKTGGLVAVNDAPDRERLIALFVLDGLVAVEEARAACPGVNWKEVRDFDSRVARRAPSAQRLALLRSLPDWLAGALVTEYGEEADEIAAALNQRAPMSIRCNTLRASRDDLQKRLTEEGVETEATRWAPHGLVVNSRINLFGLSAFQDGWFEAQDEGSQLIADLVAPPPKTAVVDYCAGAGGKALALAATLGNKGRIVAADVVAGKLKELRRRAKRAGAHNIHTCELSDSPGVAFPEALQSHLGQFKRVLVDAPCTGIGALRRNPEARWRLGPDDGQRLARQQFNIAKTASELVAPGGRLVYATCTILRAENQNVVALLLEGLPGWEIVPPKDVWGGKAASSITNESGDFLQTLPNRHNCDGFFAAVLRRKK